MPVSAPVRAIEDIIASLAPVETAEDYDNVGLLLGRRDAPVTRILVALDVTEDVAREAQGLGAELIVSHHPLLFHGRKTLVEEDPEAAVLCRLIRGRISLISAHTNLDQTEWSGSACCARLLGLSKLRRAGYLFIGELPEPLPVPALRRKIGAALSAEVRCYGPENPAPVSTLAIAGGAYGEGWEEARKCGAQALLTGEARHHQALAAAMSGFILLDAGHYATEVPLVPVLAEYLQKRLDDVQYNIRVYPSQSAPFGRA